MTLTGKTLEEDKKLVKKYEKQIDMVELRVDHLTEDEQLYVKRFPSLINLPCLLTIRRDVDGGLFSGGEFSRTSLFGRALAFANPDKSKNFAYVDFEEDYHIPSLEIRSNVSKYFSDQRNVDGITDCWNNGWFCCTYEKTVDILVNAIDGGYEIEKLM